MRPLATLLAFSAALLAAEGEVERYRFLPDQPRYLTVAVDIRDTSGRLWPALIGGRSAGGEVRLSQAGLSGQFTVRADVFAQPEGDQSRRVLGDLVKPKQGPLVELRIAAVRAGGGGATTREAELDAALDAATPSAKRPEPPAKATLEGTFVFGERTLPVAVPVTVRRVDQVLLMHGSWTVPGTELGLRPETVSIAIEVAGYRHPDDLKAPAREAAADAPELDLR